MTREEILKNAKPILFNTDMVRAILDGRKTVTRRCVKPTQLIGIKPDKCPNGLPSEFIKEKPMLFKPYCDMTDDDLICAIYKEPYKIGDILYVRETWQYLYELDGNEQIIEGTERYYYAATDSIHFNTYVDTSGVAHENVPWRPSIHMPKEAARIFLKVTDVRVERLWDITIEQIHREGVEVEYPNVLNGEEKRYAFSQLWDSTIKKSDLETYSWLANPWVWVIEFERIEVQE